MFKPIANTTFSYILTMNDFRSSIEEAHRPSWIKLTTITMVSTVMENIDIQKIRKFFQLSGSITLKMKDSSGGFKWTLKQTTFFNQITLNYTDEYSTKSVKIFKNSSIQVAGCSDLFDCNRLIKQLSLILKVIFGKDQEVPIDSFRVVMINSNFSLNYHLNLMEVVNHFGKEPMFGVSFEPDKYSAVKIKFKPAADMKQVTASIFSTGKVIVTGAETLKEIVYSYNILNVHILSSKHKIKVAKTETTDVFDKILGYTMDDFITTLPTMGFKPWKMAKINYKINF
jgi:TATA-box binding protein (TBP) (component of TFIID and TFIIIB)